MQRSLRIADEGQDPMDVLAAASLLDIQRLPGPHGRKGTCGVVVARDAGDGWLALGVHTCGLAGRRCVVTGQDVKRIALPLPSHPEHVELRSRPRKSHVELVE